MSQLTQRDAVKWRNNLFGVMDINAARQKLELLLQEEDRAVGAQTLGLVDGERIPQLVIRHSLNTLVPQGNKAALST